MKPLNVPANGGQAVNVLGTSMLIRVHGQDTGGIVSVVESHDVTDGGPPPHIHHREDETFQVLEGRYEFTVGGDTVIGEPGTTLFAPRGIAHTYRCCGAGPGRLMCVITPSGFERFFEAVGGMSPDEQRHIPRIMELAASFGLEILLPGA